LRLTGNQSVFGSFTWNKLKNLILLVCIRDGVAPAAVLLLQITQAGLFMRWLYFRVSHLSDSAFELEVCL